MAGRQQISKNVTAILVYSRPLLAFGGMLCAIGVMWTRSPILYTLGVIFLFIAMGFDLVDGWFAARFQLHAKLANLAERIMDKAVYSIIFPLVAVGTMWRLIFLTPEHTRAELLHAIFILMLCVTVLFRDNFAHFICSYTQEKGIEPEQKEFARLRTVVAAPVGALLYAYAFYIPEGPPSRIYFFISWIGNFPLRMLFGIEIIFLVINFGSIAALCRKYGTQLLDELCLGDALLRRRILSIFPNVLTIMNAMMGLLAVFFAYQYRIREAYMLLIGATIFDKLDGAVARKLGLTDPLPGCGSKKHVSLGGIMDDISDAISFCIVPAWMYYILFNSPANTSTTILPIYLIALFYTTMGIGRLIYFTLDRTPIPGFFKGMPTPAAALLVVAPMIMFNQALLENSAWIQFWSIFCSVNMIIAAIIMNIYPIRYLHIGRFMDQRPWFARLSLLLLIIAVITPLFGYLSFFYLLLYALSPFITWRMMNNTSPVSQ